jgi:Family of unknown function (DUF6600)
MTDARIILWFTWFVFSSWLRNLAMLSAQRFLKGTHSMRKALSLFLMFLFIAGAFLAAPKKTAAQDDPPSRVARLNFMQGSVSFEASGTQEWVDANPSRPLTTGDNLWVDKDSLGEVRVGSLAIRMASETGISFLNLDDRTVQIQLAQGTIEVHLRRYEPGNAVEIDTPNLAFTLTNAGEYRIETDPNGDSTLIIVREGGGQVTGGGESYDLGPGQQYTFDGTDQLSYDAQQAPGFDDFESWCQQRDQRENRSASAQYVSRDIDGYYDLDDYGDWQVVPEYGRVWVPRGIAAGWAPYHFGHWVWIAPWGWTWIGDEPWGFAPFHYGRWAFVGGYWGWVPGPLVVRPVYAPALVGFVGGSGFGVTVGFGGGLTGVAWFPLGPRDVWVPGYRCSPRYVQNANVTNTRVVTVTQVTNVYNNYTVNRTVNVNEYTYARNVSAVTVVDRETFVNARPVSNAAIRVTPEQFERARVVENAPLAPTRNSYVASTAKPVPASKRPATSFNDRKVVAKLPPPIPASGGHEPRIVDSAKPERSAEVNVKTQRNNSESNPNAQENNNRGEVRTNNTAQPPARANTNSQGEQNQHQYEQHPAVKFAPPARASDDKYDVHPPLNNSRAPEPAPKKEESRKEQPAKKDEKREPPKSK